MRFHRRKMMLLALVLLEPLALWLRGYPIGGRLIVRCRQGHLFTTLWIPGVSAKSARLLWWRLQRCPVGHHWTVVTPVKPSELSARERRVASKRRDVPIP